MTTLGKWNPFRELDEMRQYLTPFFTPRRGEGELALTPREWVPRVDVTEDEKEFLVTADLPEMKREEVKVTVEDGTLCIAGERTREKEEKTKKVHRIERAYGIFERRFTLPEGTTAEKVTAEYKDGMLRVHLPKNGTPEPKPLEVKVA